MSEEIWKDCHLTDKYSISNLGRVRNNDTGRFVKPYISKTGYAVVHLGLQPKRKVCTVHRLVLSAFEINNHFNGAVINHKDCNKSNNRLDNLEWCTQLENMQHAVINRLVPLGEDRLDSKLTESQVLEIRKLYNENITQTKLSKMFNVCQTNINIIVNNKVWTHLPWEPKPVKEKIVKEVKNKKLYTGQNHSQSKLKDSDIPLIKQRYNEIKNYTKVAKEFSISDNAVRKIIKGKTWTYI